MAPVPIIDLYVSGHVIIDLCEWSCCPTSVDGRMEVALHKYKVDAWIEAPYIKARRQITLHVPRSMFKKDMYCHVCLVWKRGRGGLLP